MTANNDNDSNLRAWVTTNAPDALVASITPAEIVLEARQGAVVDFGDMEPPTRLTVMAGRDSQPGQNQKVQIGRLPLGSVLRVRTGVTVELVADVYEGLRILTHAGGGTVSIPKGRIAKFICATGVQLIVGGTIADLRHRGGQLQLVQEGTVLSGAVRTSRIKLDPGAAVAAAATPLDPDLYPEPDNEELPPVIRAEVIEGDGAVDGLDLFSLDTGHVNALRKLRRFTPAWPRRGSDDQWTYHGSIDLDKSIDMALNRDTDTPKGQWADRERRNYWSAVADAMSQNSVGGAHHAVVHSILMEARRVASPKRSIERALLYISRMFGHGDRLGRPIAIWFGSAAILAILLTALAFCPSCSVDLVGGLGAFVDMVILPVSFLRVGPGSDTLSELLADPRRVDLRALAFVGRIIGTTAIVYAGFAARRLARGLLHANGVGGS